MNAHRRSKRDILILASNFPPVGGGIAHFIYQLARHLPPSRIRVIATPARDCAQFDRKLPFPILRLRIPAAWDARSRLFKFMGPVYAVAALPLSGTRLILCDQAHPALLSAARALRWASGARTASLVHGTDVGRRQTGRLCALYNRLLHATDQLVSNSAATQALVCGTGYPTQRSFVLNPCIDPDDYPVALPLEELRATLSLTGKRVLLTVARLVPRKGIDTVISALPALLSRIPDIHYVVAGHGPDRPRLEQLAATLRLQGHVTFTGFVPQALLPSYYSLCEVFALPSHELPRQGDIEGFGIVFLEANLFAKPVIGARSGGIADAVVDGQTGLLIRPRDPGATAEAIARLFGDRTLRQALGERGRRRVLQSFTSERAAARLLAILDGEPTPMPRVLAPSGDSRQ